MCNQYFWQVQYHHGRAYHSQLEDLGADLVMHTHWAHLCPAQSDCTIGTPSK